MKSKTTLMGIAMFFKASLVTRAQTSQFCDIATDVNDPLPVFPIPTQVQLDWHNMEFYAFVHFGINTFTNLEWGYGSESINQFSPTAAIDVEQWVTEFKNLGMKGVIITAKHHDGFCTWFTESTEHSTKNNTTTHGNVDIPKCYQKNVLNEVLNLVCISRHGIEIMQVMQELVM